MNRTANLLDVIIANTSTAKPVAVTDSKTKQQDAAKSYLVAEQTLHPAGPAQRVIYLVFVTTTINQYGAHTPNYAHHPATGRLSGHGAPIGASVSPTRNISGPTWPTVWPMPGVWGL